MSKYSIDNSIGEETSTSFESQEPSFECTLNSYDETLNQSLTESYDGSSFLTYESELSAPSSLLFPWISNFGNSSTDIAPREKVQDDYANDIMEIQKGPEYPLSSSSKLVDWIKNDVMTVAVSNMTCIGAVSKLNTSYQQQNVELNEPQPQNIEYLNFDGMFDFSWMKNQLHTLEQTRCPHPMTLSFDTKTFHELCSPFENIIGYHDEGRYSDDMERLMKSKKTTTKKKNSHNTNIRHQRSHACTAFNTTNKLYFRNDDTIQEERKFYFDKEEDSVLDSSIQEDRNSIKLDEARVDDPNDNVNIEETSKSYMAHDEPGIIYTRAAQKPQNTRTETICSKLIAPVESRTIEKVCLKNQRVESLKSDAQPDHYSLSESEHNKENQSDEIIGQLRNEEGNNYDSVEKNSTYGHTHTPLTEFKNRNDSMTTGETHTHFNAAASLPSKPSSKLSKLVISQIKLRRRARLNRQ